MRYPCLATLYTPPRTCISCSSCRSFYLLRRHIRFRVAFVMAPSSSISTTRVVTFILLCLHFAEAVALPNRLSRHPNTPNPIEARTPGTEETHNVAITLNDKKEGKNFFKELGNFLSDFDPIDVFRTILGGLLGFEEAPDADTTSVASPSPTTTILVTPTPVEATTPTSTVQSALGSSIPATSSSSKPVKTVSSMKRITVTKKVTATKSSATIKSSSDAVASTPSEKPGEIFSVLPFFPPEEPLDLTGLAPTAVPTADLAGTSLTGAAIESTGSPLPLEVSTSEEVLSILPAPVGPVTGDWVWPTVVLIPESDEASATPFTISDLSVFEVAKTSTQIAEGTVSILPFIPSGQHISDNVTWPTSIEVVEPLETFSVVTEPVAPVPVETEIFSILPFIESGKHLSDNVTWPTPTDVVIAIPELPIPVVTAPAESLDAFLESISISTPVSTEVRAPLQTGVDDLDNLPFPLLEFVNGTYVLPTKKPHFATPVLSLPNWNSTAKATRSARKTSTKKLTSTKRPRYTKPIVLPPPLVRPTNFPLNLTFFANQTKQAKTSTKVSTRPLILTNPFRPTIQPLPLYKPFSNHTNKMAPIFIKPTRPLILTNPLGPTVEVLKPQPTNQTTTTTVKIRSTKLVTVIIIPTPAAEGGVPETSIADIDVSDDEPSPTGSDLGDSGVLPLIDDVGNSTIDAVLIPLKVSSISTIIPTPSSLELGEPVSSISLDFFIEDISTSTPSPSLSIPSSSLAVGKPSATLLDASLKLPLSSPIPTPRTLPAPPTNPTLAPPPALPSSFPLPKPAIDANITFSVSSGRLTEYCADPKIKSITLPLLQKWYGPNAYPSLAPYPGCVPPNPRQALQAPGLLNCTALGKEVQACQRAGKRVLLGVKVDGPSAVNGNLKYGAPDTLGVKLPLAIPPGPFLGRPGHPLVPLAGNLTTVVLGGKRVPAPNLFDAVHTPSGLAATLWSLFGEGHAERADLRPLGPDAPSEASPDRIKWVVKPLGEEVVVDGFDVRTPGQWKGTAQARLVDGFVEALREKEQVAWKEIGGKTGGLGDLGVDGPGLVVSGYI